MLKKMSERINHISYAARFAVVLGCVTGGVLMFAAAVLSVLGNMPLVFVYMREHMARTAVTLFAEGVFLGLSGDFLLAIVDRDKK